jgi:hypothetical protein
MKVCTCCKQAKAISEFNKHPTHKDGYNYKCKPCEKEYKRQHRLNNPEKYRQKNKERYAAAKAKNPNLGKEAYMKREGNAIRERGFKRNPNGLGRDLSKRRKTSSQYQHRRRSLQAKVVWSEFDEFVFEEAIDLRNRRQELTGFNWHVDHIVPLRNEDACGLHNGFNLQVVPAKWNIDKKHKHMDTYFPIDG